MVQFSLAGRTWEAYVNTYTVRSVDISHINEVHGGDVYTVNGHVQSTPVQNTVITRKTIWLTRSDGKDCNLAPLCDVAAGHQVRILFFGEVGNVVQVSAHNLNSDRVDFVGGTFPWPNYVILQAVCMHAAAILRSDDSAAALDQIIKQQRSEIERRIDETGRALARRRKMFLGAGAALVAGLAFAIFR